MRKKRKYNYKTLKELLKNKYTVNIETGCWQINSKYPYGRLCYYENGLRKYIGYHQASYKVHIGDIPKDKWILHKCNNNYCCNPNHLYAGDRKQNENDKVIAGSIKGIKHPNHKLEEIDVLKIKELIKNGLSNIDISKMFNVKKSAISKIRTNRTWKHLS